MYPSSQPMSVSTSGTGSISRRRVGSLSQRGNEPLTPLDIQSIQMPSNPQNALALKTAALSSTKSLYQTCSTLRKRLRCVEDFAPFLDQPPTAEPLDAVAHVCHILRLGSPLCHLYNLLIPSFLNPSSPLYASSAANNIPKTIEYDFPDFHSYPQGVKNWAKRPENAKMCQKYIAMFCMAIKQRQSEGRWPGEIWALHELWGKSTGEEAEAYDSTGLMKVLHTVETMLDNLPESAISPLSPHTPYTGSALGHMSRQSYDVPFSMGGTGSGLGAVANMAATMNGGVHLDHAAAGGESGGLSPVDEMGGSVAGPSKSTADANAFKSVDELVSSEKSYVQELEILVRCGREMLDAQLISTETSHKIFSTLPKILDFHRKFLIKLEMEYEPVEEGRSWAEGRWGRPFCTTEAEFECYGPFCANYLEAVGIINQNMPNLLRGQTLPASERPCLHPERELPAFMIKPIQRITKYGLLLDAILHATAKHDYPYRAELEDGAQAVRRIAQSINETTDLKAKLATVRELEDRVEDWKGHELEKFGDLYLDDHFTVTKADQPREYHVFLFEKMMLCCKEVVPERGGKKGSKNSSMLRKDKGQSKTGLGEKRKLALKGRIFVSNINRASLVPADPNEPYAAPKLIIAWTVPHRHANGWSEDVEDSFVMIGKTEDQMKKWADKVMDLATAERRKQEEARAERMRASGRYSGSERGHQQSSFAPPTPASETPPFSFPPPLPHHQQTVYEDDDADSTGLRSGRTTPSIGCGPTYTTVHPATGRRVQSQQGMPVDRQAELRARAMTEDQFGPSMSQWRNQAQPPPLPRLTSAMSALSTISTASEASFGNGVSAGRMMGRQMSASRLGRADEVDEDSYFPSGQPPPPQQTAQFNRFGPARGMSRAPSTGITPSVPYPHPPPLRSRSASSPNVYQQPTVTPAPPIPHSAAQPDPYNSSTATLVGGTAYFSKRMSGSGGKRSSGESHSTETSETSSGQSPATPYGSVPAMLGGTSRQNSQDSAAGPPGNGMVLVKVRCGDDQFIISVSPDIDFGSLYQKVQKKVRYASARAASPIEANIQIKWIDTDNDEISLRCDADIEAMFGEVRDSGLHYVNLVAR